MQIHANSVIESSSETCLKGLTSSHQGTRLERTCRCKRCSKRSSALAWPLDTGGSCAEAFCRMNISSIRPSKKMYVIYLYIYIDMYTYIHTYIYIYIYKMMFGYGNLFIYIIKAWSQNRFPKRKPTEWFGDSFLVSWVLVLLEAKMLTNEQLYVESLNGKKK